MNFIAYAAPGFTHDVPDPPSLPTVRRKGTGERVLTATLAGGVGYGWPGGWSQDRREQSRHFKFWTYVAVTCIMDECARYIPHLGYVQPKDHKGGWREKTYRERRYLKTMHHVKPHEDVEMVEDDHPLLRIFEQPNAWDSAGLPDLIKEWVMFQCLHGNGYWWIIPHLLTGMPEQLFILPSHWVWARYNRNTPTGLEHYEIRPFIGPGQFVIPPEELIHTREKNPLHKIDGYSPQQAIDHWVDELESAHRARFWQFRNQTGLSGAIELPPDYHDPDDQEMERIYAKVFSRLQGESNYGRPAILGPGMKFVPLKVTPAESDFFNTVEQLRDSVLAAWKVPKEVAGVQPSGGDLSWYAPLQQFVRNNIAPRLSYLGHVLTHWLCKRYDKNLRLWWDDPTPDNPEQVNRDLEVNYQNGLMTINEGRAVRGLEPSDEPNAEKLLVAKGLVLLENAGQEEKPMQHNVNLAGALGSEGGQNQRPFGKQIKDASDDKTAASEEDPELFAELVADILYGVYGEDALTLLEGDSEEKGWDPALHPRGPDGRFVAVGSAAAGAASRQIIAMSFKKRPVPADVHKLMGYVNLMTVKQLKTLHKEHGIRAPGRLRAQLIQSIHDAMSAHVAVSGKRFELPQVCGKRLFYPHVKDTDAAQRARRADLITFGDDVPEGALCSDCQYVGERNGEDYCENENVDQPLPDGRERMCCSLWDRPGTDRHLQHEKNGKAHHPVKKEEKKETPIFNVNLPPIHINLPEQAVMPAPEVNVLVQAAEPAIVPAPEVKVLVEAPPPAQVNVHTPEVKVLIQPPPPPQIHVKNEPPVIHNRIELPAPTSHEETMEVERDADGRILSTRKRITHLTNDEV